MFDDACIRRVRITTGDVAPGPDDDEKNDIVVMDDFIYAEPVESMTVQGAQKDAKDLLATDENALTEAAAPWNAYSEGRKRPRERTCRGHNGHGDS